MSKNHLLLATSAVALLTVGASALAPAAAQQLEEIVVTARKVEENLMEVPIAITAFSARDIEAMGVKQLNDVSQFTPSFHFVNQQGGSGRNDRSSNSLVFRGLFLNLNTGVNAGGQLFIDGAPVLGAQPPAITDVERIEVLKGPQSAYFGRSTFVGAINYVTREPADEFKGRIGVEYGSYNQNEQTLSLEGPLVADKLSARISFRHYARDGHYVNAFDTNQRLGSQDTKSVSATLSFRPNDALKIKGYVNFFEDQDGPPAQAALKQDNFNCVLSNPAAGAPRTTRAHFGYYCGAIPNLKQIPKNIISGDYALTPYQQGVLFDAVNPNWLIFDPHYNTEDALRRKAFQADVRADYETAGGYVFTSVTAHHTDKSQNLIDLNYRGSQNIPNCFSTQVAVCPPGVNPNPLFRTFPNVLPTRNFLLVSQGRFRDWSQELRITSPADQRFRWTIGGNYIDAFSPGGPVYGNGNTGPIFTSGITEQKFKTPAVFGAAYFDILPELTISAEARYQWDKIQQQAKIGITGNPVTGAAATPLKETFKSFSPRVSIDYKFAPDSTIYVLFSRGYRPGGFNTALLTASPAVLAALRAVVPNADLAYEEERLDNYEAGIKASFLDNRARATLSVYYDKWKGGQVGNSIPVQVAGVNNLINLTVNTGLANLKGFEFEGQFQATEQLKLSATMGLNDTDVRSFVCGDCNNVYGNFDGVVGNSLPAAPRWTWTASAEYTDELTADYDWYSRVDYSHTGKKFTDFSNVAWVPNQDIVNLKLGVRNETMSIEAFVNNLTQNRVPPAALLGIDVFTFQHGPNKNEIRFSLPLKRVFGVRAYYNF